MLSSTSPHPPLYPDGNGSWNGAAKHPAAAAATPITNPDTSANTPMGEPDSPPAPAPAPGPELAHTTPQPAPQPTSRSLSNSYTYPRSTLLSLAKSPEESQAILPPSTMRRLSSFTPILRCSVALSESEWGVSEDNSSLLTRTDGSSDPASLSNLYTNVNLNSNSMMGLFRRGVDLPMRPGEPHPADRSSQRKRSDSAEVGGIGEDELLFHFSSFSENRPPPPVLVDFANPFSFALHGMDADEGRSGRRSIPSHAEAGFGAGDSPSLSDGSLTTSPVPVDSGTDKYIPPSRSNSLSHHQPQKLNQGQTSQARQDQILTHAQLGLPEPPAGIPIRLGARKASASFSYSTPASSGNMPVSGAGGAQYWSAAFPSSANSSTTSLTSLRLGARESVADLRRSISHSHLFPGAHSHSQSQSYTPSGGGGGGAVGGGVGEGGRASRSNSNSSIGSNGSVYSMASGLSHALGAVKREGEAPAGEKLNPFAAPFASSRSSPSKDQDQNQDRDEDESPASNMQAGASLPAPKPSLTVPLPSSLPARPGPLPPVFVKRESAALPQPMALRDVAPLGRGWEGEASLSGNDRRRRGSFLSTTGSSSMPAELVNGPLGLPHGGGGGGSLGGSRRGSFASDSGAAGGGANRPERLLRLGQGLRSHSPQPRSQPGSRRGSHSSLRGEI